MKILSNRPICLYIAMRLSIYSDSFTCGDYLLKIPRLVSWYQRHGLGLGLGYSNSPTIQFFFTLGSILSLRGVVRLVCSAHRRTSAPFARPVGSLSRSRGPSSILRAVRAARRILLDVRAARRPVRRRFSAPSVRSSSARQFARLVDPRESVFRALIRAIRRQIVFVVPCPLGLPCEQRTPGRPCRAARVAPSGLRALLVHQRFLCSALFFLCCCCCWSALLAVVCSVFLFSGACHLLLLILHNVAVAITVKCHCFSSET